MLGRETLFIIGAGAGHDIEMPMGEKLASTIAANLNIVFEDFGQKKRSGHDTMIDALRLVARQDNPSGDVNPYFNAGRQIHEGLLGWFSSIDGYLNRHQDQPFVQQCGKMAIVQCILESEHACHMHINQMPGTTPAFRDAEKLRSSWFQRLWAILETGIVRSKNLDSIFDKLHVITYDRTLEHFLLMGLRQAYHLEEKEAAAIINARLDIDHVYGKVADLPWEDKGHGFGFGRKPRGNELVPLWKRIKTFNEEMADKKFLEKLSKKVAAAERIVFLGFHFHEQGMRLLRTPAVAHGRKVEVYATGFERSRSDLSAIETQMHDMLVPSCKDWDLHIQNDWDCKGLFKEFAWSWARG